MLSVAVCCGSLRFVVVPCGSLRFVAVRCGSVRCGSVHVRFVAMSGSFRFGSLAVRFISVRFVRFVVLLLAVRFGSRQFGSVHAVRFGSAAILKLKALSHSGVINGVPATNILIIGYWVSLALIKAKCVNET